MGCASSKLDSLPAVALCRDRCEFLDEAIRLRFALAEAHLSYMQCLKEVGVSLHNFFDQDVDMSDATQVLTLAGDKKADLKTVEAARGSSSTDISHSHHLILDSDSGSGGSGSGHLDLNSDTDDGELGSGPSGHFHHHESGGFVDSHPGAHHVGQFGHCREFEYEIPGGYSNRYMHMSYVKNQAAAPSMMYEQRQFSTETGYMDVDRCSHYNYGVYGDHNVIPSSTSSYGGYTHLGSGFDSRYSHFGSRDESKPPPSPPSPPRESSWEFFNPFASFYEPYSTYPSSRDLKEVREEEGIPELEEEDPHEALVVKEVYGKKPADVASDSGAALSEEILKVDLDNETLKVDVGVTSSPRSPSVPIQDDGRLEFEVHRKEVNVDCEARIEGSVNEVEPHSITEVVKEIQLQFERASDAGNELADLLEVGRLPYHKKHGVSLAPSKMLHAITPSLPVVFSKNSPSAILSPSDIDEVTETKNLSVTLQKLYLWEKKLYTEIKAEEKMRVLHDRKRRKLMHLDEKGAEADKAISTRNLIRSLSTKIRIAIQVVDRISTSVNKIRDEELWPQISQLIHGLSGVWKSMLECHQSQFQAIKAARNLDTAASHKKFSDANLKATLQLEHELINWALRFSSWICIQKEFAKALNNWLFKCLLYEPEETPDGIAPFSPSRIGAPPIFGICNQWVQALDQISEKEVVDAMSDLTTSVFSYWERDRLILRQNLVTNKELEKQVRSLDRDDHRIRKDIQALDKRIVSISRASSGLPVNEPFVYQSDTSNTTLHNSLQRVFESMEKFSSGSTEVYEDLIQRINEERLAPAPVNPETS